MAVETVGRLVVIGEKLWLRRTLGEMGRGLRLVRVGVVGEEVGECHCVW